MKLAVCMYGSIRTFVDPKLREKYKLNFTKSISNLGEYDVFVLLIRQANGVNHRSRLHENCKLTKQDLEAMLIDIFGKKLTYFKVYDNNDSLFPTKSEHAKQLWGIDEVFFTANKHDYYDFFVRIRPDFYWHQSFDHTVLNQTHVVTSIKSDAPASDMFFIISKQLYNDWWVKTISQLKYTLTDCIEYTIFKNVRKLQHHQIHSSLMRNNNEKMIDTWN